MSKVGELFRPADENVKRNSQIERFRRFINARYSTELEDPWQLHSWSVDNRALFWDAIWDYFCFIGEKGAQPVRKLHVHRLLLHELTTTCCFSSLWKMDQ